MDERPKTDRGNLDGMFCDEFSIGFNAYVLVFDFGMKGSDGTTHTHTKVVTSPATAREFCDVLNQSLREHVEKYGPLKREPR